MLNGRWDLGGNLCLWVEDGQGNDCYQVEVSRRFSWDQPRGKRIRALGKTVVASVILKRQIVKTLLDVEQLANNGDPWLWVFPNQPRSFPESNRVFTDFFGG